MELTYYTNGGSGDGGDQYTGLDRFGRVVDQRWDVSGRDVDRFKYGYDRAGNRIWRQNTVAGTGQDEFYTVDGLYRLATLQRGTLNSGKTGISGTPTWEEDWNHDPLGNWHGTTSGYVTKASGITTLEQNRTHNAVNEISGLTTASGIAWVASTHDAAGNMTTVPQPLSPGSGYDLKYDAWNRLVQVWAGGTLMCSYSYDGANRRITKSIRNRHYYYDDQWLVVEERLESLSTADRRFVWGIRRLDYLILRDRHYSAGEGSSSSTSSGWEPASSSSSSSRADKSRMYAADDLANVTAVLPVKDEDGIVAERYGYDGFGAVRYMNHNFANRPVSHYDWETLYSSYRHDTETGLYLARFRYLHPLFGRWMSRDPIQEFGGLNLDAYCNNGPVSGIDPLGLAIGNWWDARTWFNSGFTESWSDSANSIGQSLGGSLVWAYDKTLGNSDLASGDADSVADAYDNSVLGQTVCGPGWAKYGTRAALVFGTAAAATAASLMALDLKQASCEADRPRDGFLISFDLVRI